MADPLSSATRANKRNLLVVSVIAISASAFNVSIDKIPVGGLSISFDDRLFAFLLVVVLLYFLATFILYYAIDMKNLDPTGHQLAAEKKFQQRLAAFPPKYFTKLKEGLEKLVPANYELRLHDYTEDYKKGKPRAAPYEVRTPIMHKSLDDAENKKVCREIDKRQQRYIKSFAKAQAMDRWLGALTLYGTRSMYTARNYFFDGFLPIGLGLFAVIVIFGHIDLSWFQAYLPSFRALSKTASTLVGD